MIPAAIAVLLLAPALVAPLSAGELSFACRMTKSARAMATCAHSQLATADIDLEAAYESMLARVDAETTTALREDQRKYLADLDRGFESSVWGKADPPQGAALRAAIEQMHRGADRGPLAALEVQMRERIAFLRSLAQPRSVTGLWKNNNAELLIVHVDPDLATQTRSAKAGVNFGDDDRGHYEVTFGMVVYGFPQDHCHFTAAFRAAADGLRALARTTPIRRSITTSPASSLSRALDRWHSRLHKRCQTTRLLWTSVGFARTCRR
jgi:uncharacterized protein